MSIPIKCGGGLNADLLPSELDDGAWSVATNFRFRHGFAERWQGFGTAMTGLSAAYWIARFDHNADRYLVSVNSTGMSYAYEINSGAGVGPGFAISPPLPPVAISTITRVSAVLAEVTTSSVHSLNTNDVITVFGVTESGYNVSNVAVTVMSTTVFRYAVSAIAANATVVGGYAVISAGTTSIAGTRIQKITGGTINGYLIVNSPVTGIYYWDGDSATNFAQFGFKSYVADVARPFKQFIVQLGRTVNGVKRLQNVAWSASAEPGTLPDSFDASDTNDAGDVDLAESSGPVVDCLQLANSNIIYMTDAIYAMQYIGGNDVFRFTRIPGTDGALGTGFVTDTPLGHVFLTSALDVRLHSGGESRSIASGRVKKYLNSLLASSGGAFATDRKQGFLITDYSNEEVWLFLRTINNVASAGCDRALVWSWASDTWSVIDLSDSTETVFSATRGGWATTDNQGLLVTKGTFLGSSEYTNNGTARSGTLERTGLDFGDRDTFKSIHRSRWNIDGTAGQTVAIYHGSSKTADGTVTWTSPVTYTIGTTDYVNARATAGRFGAIKVVSSSATYSLSVRSADIGVATGGKR
jgi:hypothetical protein